MSRYRLELLVMAGVGALLIVLGAFVLDWFKLDVAGTHVAIDMRSMRACTPDCTTLSLARMTGMFPSLAMLGFFSSIVLLLALIAQTAARVFAGIGYARLGQVGLGLGMVVFACAVAAGYLFAPETNGLGGDTSISVERTLAPLLLGIGAVVTMVAMRYAPTSMPTPMPPAASPDAPSRSRPATNRLEIVSTTRGRPTNPPAMFGLDAPPLDGSARSKPPTNRLEIVSSTRGRPTNPPGVDVSARLSAAPLAAPANVLVPLPPTPVAPPGEPGDPIAADADLKLTFRRRNPSTAPPPMHALQNALANPLPPALRGKVAYACILAELSSAGITGNREDGFARLIRWRDIVGIVARRLPQASPYHGAAFVDVVSSVGSTLRVLPWTEINGLPLHQTMIDPTERLRSFVQLLAAQCLEAQLDPATRTFSRGNGKPAQLPDEQTLALHDDKLR